MQENHSIYLLKFCISKIKLLSTRSVLRNQNPRQSYQVVCCGQVFQRGKYLQKPMNRLRNLFITVFYNTPRLRSIQMPMTALKCLLIVTLNHSWFQIFYCNCLYGNFILAWRVPQKKVDLRKQDTKTILSSVVILHYNQFFYPNLRKFL